jgi:hypothetical protein
MLRTLVGLACVAMLALPAIGQDKKKPIDVDRDDTKAVADGKKKALAAGKIAGKLTQLEATQKNLTVQVMVKVPNPAFNMAASQRQLAEASADRNPVNRARRVAEIQANMAKQMYKDHPLNVELQASDDVKVRTFNLPLDYDDKGKPRKYTQKELKDLKGPDPKLPGYTSDFESLKTGQEVEVSILVPKNTPKPKVKDKDRDVVAEEERPKATMIVILREPQAR